MKPCVGCEWVYAIMAGGLALKELRRVFRQLVSTQK